MFFINNSFHRFINYTLVQQKANITLLKIADEYQKVSQRRPVDFEIRDEILEKLLVNKPKDYMKLEQEMRQSFQMNRQVQELFSKVFF